ncbi:MAG TPA: lactate racemase domain-containing protein [Lacipirellula sp.]
MTTLTFGNSLRCKLELDDYTFLAANSELHPTLDDPALAVREALANPRGYPPLAAATVPGDHIAVAVDSGVPQLRSILRGVIGAMLDAEVPPAMITIVSADAIENREELDRDLVEMGAGGVKFELHEPDDEQALAMVGVNAHGEPLRMNRTLAEADFVLPIGVGQSAAANGDGGEKFASLFPRFSTREAADRIKVQSASESPKQHKRRSKEIDEAGWLLGIGMTVSVVPTAAGGVAAVVAGDPQAVAEAASEQSRSIWERSAERQGDLVIATVVGDRREQTWENLARALSTAAPLVEPGGAIALYTELDEPPSGSLNRLLEAVDFGDVQRELMQDDAVQAHPAMMLARALELGPVYLRSRLPADVVESLGMTPIEDDDELAHLTATRAHCVVIEEAQRVVCRLVPREEL